MFSYSPKLQAKLYAQALLDLDYISKKVIRTAILAVIFTSIVDSLNVNYLPTITQE